MTLSLITAHPDDESWAFSTLLFAAEALGWPVRILCLTSGDAGVDARSAHDVDATQGVSLGALREQELRRAMSRLDTAVDLTFARLPDGQLPRHRAAVHRALDAWWDPASTLTATWGPAGGYGHVDHVLCFEVCSAYFRTRDARVWTAHFPWASAQTVHRSLSRFRGGSLVIPAFEGAYAAETPALRLPVNPLKKRKILQEHHSQIGRAGVDNFVHPALTAALLEHEYFSILYGSTALPSAFERAVRLDREI